MPTPRPTRETIAKISNNGLLVIVSTTEETKPITVEKTEPVASITPLDEPPELPGTFDALGNAPNEEGKSSKQRRLSSTPVKEDAN